ncbi:phosphotransferase family protein, partial [Pseudomaricurvus sp.]|uniref:phosphotransferase family protein n=1 Tax=Pseudomaricurvus sp. TaxID=2004510 RepID=UPI003F6BE4DB
GSTWLPLENLKSLCQSLHQLHQIQTDSDVANFDLLQHCDHYWRNIHNALSPNALSHDLFQRCRQHLTDTLKHHSEQCLCHNDLNPDNILRQKNDFVFLDWEYACNNSPYFELATLVEFYALSEDETAQLSSTYWKDSNEEQHLSALQAFRIVVRFIEWLWLALKESDLLIPCENRLTLLLQRYGT